MLLWFFPFKRALLWTLATVPCVHAFPYLFLSSAPKGALPGPAADSPTRPRVSQLTALTQTGDSRPTQGEAMSTAMPTKVPLSPPRGSGSQHTQAWRRPRAPGHSYLPQKSWRRLCRAGRSLCPALCHRQGHAEPTDRSGTHHRKDVCQVHRTAGSHGSVSAIHHQPVYTVGVGGTRRCPGCQLRSLSNAPASHPRRLGDVLSRMF